MTLDLLMEVVGWIGATLILGAYALLTAGKIRSDSVAYQLLNVVGALGFIANGLWHRAMPSAVLNIVWAGIGLFALVRIQAKARARRG